MGEQARWHLRRRQHEVHRARVDRTDRHPIELGGRGILHQGETGGCADRRETERAIRAGAGEDDAGGMARLIAGECAKEEIDRQVRNSARHDRLQAQHPRSNRHVLPAQLDVDVIRLDPGLLADSAHRQPGALREDLGEHAVSAGSLMAHDDEGHAAVGGNRGEEFAQWRERAGRAPDSDD